MAIPVYVMHQPAYIVTLPPLNTTSRHCISEIFLKAAQNTNQIKKYQILITLFFHRKSPILVSKCHGRQLTSFPLLDICYYKVKLLPKLTVSITFIKSMCQKSSPQGSLELDSKGQNYKSSHSARQSINSVKIQQNRLLLQSPETARSDIIVCEISHRLYIK